MSYILVKVKLIIYRLIKHKLQICEFLKPVGAFYTIFAFLKSFRNVFFAVLQVNNGQFEI